MGNTSAAQHYKQAQPILKTVWYAAGTAVHKGQGFCYNRDYGTATDAEEARGQFVEDPSPENNRAFAGVAVKDYAAVTGGFPMVIAEPGSVVPVLCGVDTTAWTSSARGTIVTCSASEADPGWFTQAGFPGRGTAEALQTTTAGCIAEFLDGSATSAWSSPLLTITETALGTKVAAATDPKIVVLGGADAATGGSVTTGEMAVVGIYDATYATADTVTITTDIGNVDVTGYAVDGYPTVLAYLQTGEESGLQEFVSSQDNSAATGRAAFVTSMVGGVTYLCGGYTQAADCAFTLANGTIRGEVKAFKNVGVLTTKGYVVTVTSGKYTITNDANGALATLSFLLGTSSAMLQWSGNAWVLLEWTGAVPA